MDIKVIVLILAFGFTLAAFLGYLSLRLKLSPLLGYLLAGYVIGPYSPGLKADLGISEQLAEIGVILMLFGVGMHFRWRDLVSYRYVAVPGAIIQIFLTTVLACVVVSWLGWTLEAGILFGLAIGVASTVVLVRVFSENHLLNTPEGHLTIGWLIVEDLITVGALVSIPLLAESTNGKSISYFEITEMIFWILLKFSLLVLIAFTVIKKLAVYLFDKVAKTHSNELFTISVLSMVFIIALGASYIFGLSIAIGAFLAGMIVGQTEAHHRASHHTMPIRDAFMVIFFLSIGMLFNPMIIIEQFPLFIGTVFLIIFLKPLMAFLLALALRQPFRNALVVAVGLAQIGEFSFILSEEGTRLNVLPDVGYDILVASALVAIAINPLLFKVFKLQGPEQKS